MAPQHFRIFISSPSDVFAERERVERVITRLNGEFGGGLLEAIRWERSYYTAAKTFQDQIALPSETDLVICILWKRLGFELPPEYVRPDGTTPTGTEYEFEDAMAAARAKGTPDVLVYRKAAPVLLNAEQVELERAQFEALKTFWARWFRTESGHFTAAYQSFDTTDQFETEVEDHIRQWLARHKVASAGVTWPIEQRGSPFRGLQAFDAAHADVFFGRRRVVERARERLTDAARRGTPFLLVLGTSGSGKSSVARAGLLPRLTQPGAVPGVDVWRCCVMRPSEGDSPPHALARALYRPESLPELAEGDNPSPADFAQLLSSAPDAAARAVRLALSRGTAAIAAREGFDRAVEARLLLVVDQFEEALAPPEAREVFARALAALAASGVTWVVATLRSDLYALFQASAALMALRDGGAQLDLVPPSATELAEIVTGPAAAAGLKFDTRPDGTGLDEVLTGAADQPGALPLLQLALDALFEARDPQGLLTFAAFDALGGLSGVVERRAEATLAALDADAAAALPAVLRAVVDVTDDGVVTSRAALADAFAQPSAARRLIDGFVAARLLLLDTQGALTRVRVAHDALLSGWPRAAALIERDREMLRTRGRVEAATRRWLGEDRQADFLLPPGRPLAEAVELATHEPDSLDAASAAFVAASREADAARAAAAAALAERDLRLEAEAQQARADAATRVVRRTRLAAVVVSALLIVAVGAAMFASQQRNEARRQAVRAEQQTAVAERQTMEAETQTAKAQQNFQAALDSGASLIAAVNAHLADGGMTRRVARELLDTANAGMGPLLPRNPQVAMPPALLDTQSRLEVSFSRVLAAVCGGGEARARAMQALATAETVARQAPSDERERAVVTAMHAVGLAAESESDWTGAQAIFEQAEARALPHAGDAWKDVLQTVRQDLAYTISDGPQRDHAVALLREDLAWEQEQEKLRPNDLSIQARAAKDERFLGYAARMHREFPAALADMDREAGLLHYLADKEPANFQWQRLLSNNALQRSLVLKAQGDMTGSLALVREAAAGAATLVARDPANALWLIGKLSIDINLGGLLREGGDLPGAKAVLRSDLEAVKALSAEGGGSRMCRKETALLQTYIGNAMAVMGSSEEAVAALEASLALTRSLAAGAPDDTVLRHDVADAELSLARAMVVAEKPQGAAAHARAGIAALQSMMARTPATPEWQAELSQLREYLGDALVKAGDTGGALVAFEQDRRAGDALAAAAPGNGQWRNQVAVSLLRIATVQGLRGSPDAQWNALQAATSAVAPLAGRPDLPLSWQRTIIDVRQAVATTEFIRHDHAAGLAHYQEALVLAEVAAKQFPDDPAARAAPIHALMYLGMAYRIDGQAEQAKAADERREALTAAPERTRQ